MLQLLLFVITICIITNINGYTFMEHDSDQYNTIAQNKFRKAFYKLWATNYRNPLPLQDEYDFIIVGAGPAGCALANRLSEDGKFSILLLEAGKPDLPVIVDVPMASPNLQSTGYNWGYATEAQPESCQSMNDGRCNWPHGRGLGGSSIINYAIFTRGSSKDYDKWGLKNPGWSYKDVLPYFKKLENFMADTTQEDSDYHGYEGPLDIENVPYRTKLADAFLKSANILGYPTIDYNGGGNQIGVSYIQSSTRDGWRHTAGRAYLDPILDRSNLHIYTESWVIKIHFNQNQDHAIGVTFLNNRQKYFIRAKNEVILSAGAFESAKLLMLSGIGPRSDLKKLNIDVIKDLPVGRTLYEHIAVYGPIFTVGKQIDDLYNIENVINLKTMLEFFSGRGPLTSNGIESLLYFKTNNSVNPDPNHPDIELMQSLATVSFDTVKGTQKGIRLSDEAYNAVFKPLEYRRAFQLLPMLLHPRSKGYLKLKSKNPFHHPIFVSNFFKDTRDLDTILEGIRKGIEIISQKPFQHLDVQLYEAIVPGCEHFQFNTDEYWKCYARYLTATLHHQVGTCKMGPITDPTSVVNANLYVHGIQNLRVVDIGIIPESPSGHTAAISFMIGEKAADMIKYSWSNEIDIRKRSIGRCHSVVKRNIKRRFDWQYIDELSMDADEQDNESVSISNANNLILDDKSFGNETVIGNRTGQKQDIEKVKSSIVGDVGLILWGVKESAPIDEIVNTTEVVKINGTTKSVV